MMSSDMASTNRLWLLMEAACLGRISEGDLFELQEMLRGNAELQKIYLDYCRMHSELRFLFRVERASNAVLPSLTSQRPSVPVIPSALYTSPSVSSFLTSGWPMAYLMATVVMIVGIIIGAHTYVPTGVRVASEWSHKSEQGQVPVRGVDVQTVARITGMTDCVWEEAGGDHSPETNYRKPSVSLGDTFVLRSGLLEITYDTGAKVVLQGPVRYDVESAAGGYLALGKLTARLEKGSKSKVQGSTADLSAHLFAVRTPTAVVTDLGTEFCVEVHKDETSDVHVRSGKVELATRKGGQRRLLRADGSGDSLKSARVEASGENGSLRIVAVTLDPGRFDKMVARLAGAQGIGNASKKILVQSRFNLSNEGWSTTLSGTGANYRSNEGHPGGCIQTAQNKKNNDAFYYIASPMFLGDRSAAFGGQLKFDVITSYVNSDEPLLEQMFWMELPLVILEGRKGRIATDLPAAFARDQWTTLSVPLDSRGKWYRFVGDRDSLEGKQKDRTPVSDDVIREVLADLRDMWIRAEYLRGEDTGRLDNVLFIAPDGSAASVKQRDTTTGSALESAKSGKRVPGAAPQTNPNSGEK
jgi:hypothetical protein